MGCASLVGGCWVAASIYHQFRNLTTRPNEHRQIAKTGRARISIRKPHICLVACAIRRFSRSEPGQPATPAEGAPSHGLPIVSRRRIYRLRRSIDAGIRHQNCPVSKWCKPFCGTFSPSRTPPRVSKTPSDGSVVTLAPTPSCRQQAPPFGNPRNINGPRLGCTQNECGHWLEA